jgi:hypothetical protein
MFKQVILPRVGIFLLITLVAGIIGGILESNIVQGEYKTKFGTVKVPGSKVLHLPAGTTDVAFAAFLPGAGNETPDMPIPKNLGLDVKPAGAGVEAPTVTRDVGTSANSSAEDTNTDIRIWKLDVAEDGDYEITAKGGSGALINQTLELGTGPALPIGYMWLAAGVIGLLAALFGPQLYSRWRPGRSSGDSQDSRHVGYGLERDSL